MKLAEVLDLTARMLDAAAAEDWDAVTRLSRDRATRLEALTDRLDERDAPDLARVHAGNEALIGLVEAARAERGRALRRMGRGRRATTGYAAAG